MKGKHHIVVQNNKLRYEFDIKRNITIIRGDSATGKTTLINLLESAANLGESSGVEVVCDKSCVVLQGYMWKTFIENTHDSIIFIDEEFEYLRSVEFAKAVKESDNYFVIISRYDFPNLPYAVEEIYEIHTSGKYHDMRRTYNEFRKIYSVEELYDNVKPGKIVLEDSNSGYEFFSKICEEKDVVCESAGGKSNLVKFINRAKETEVLAIADGAAIGAEMNELYQLMLKRPNVKCYLPESFEWIILKSGLIGGKEVQEILNQPEEHIESGEFFSWERYFTRVLVNKTEGTYLFYSKSSLNSVYLQEKEKQAILNVMEGISLENKVE